MTLDQQIQLIDELIRENLDATIKDYWKAIHIEKEKMLTVLIFQSSMNRETL